MDGLKRQIILASTSPRRKELLQQIGVAFMVEPSDYEEDMMLEMAPADLVAFLARGKATAVAAKHPGAIVIGADSIIVFNNQVIGKPKSAADAQKTLKLLRGKHHQVMTGLCIMCAETDKTLVNTGITDVYFRDITDIEINDYVESGQPLDKAGSYAIQDHGAVFVEKINGEYSTVVGLPLMKTWQFLQEFIEQ